MNKWNVPVRHGEKCLLYPFYKQDPSYLSKFPLNLIGFLSAAAPPTVKKYVTHERAAG